MSDDVHTGLLVSILVFVTIGLVVVCMRRTTVTQTTTDLTIEYEHGKQDGGSEKGDAPTLALRL